MLRFNGENTKEEKGEATPETEALIGHIHPAASTGYPQTTISYVFLGCTMFTRATDVNVGEKTT